MRRWASTRSSISSAATQRRSCATIWARRSRGCAPSRKHSPPRRGRGMSLVLLAAARFACSAEGLASGLALLGADRAVLVGVEAVEDAHGEGVDFRERHLAVAVRVHLREAAAAE